MDNAIAQSVSAIMATYRPEEAQSCAEALRAYWLPFETNKGIELIKADQRRMQETNGTPVPVLKDIAKTIARAAGKDVDGYIPLAQTLWDMSREGRIVALIIFGEMELVDPQRIVPIIKQCCRGCLSWEDVDRLAMDALEPVVRKQPDPWLNEIVSWLSDDNKWLRRAAVTVIGRLPLKHPVMACQCLALGDQLLNDGEPDVKKAVSFAIRLIAKVNPNLVRTYLEQNVPPTNPASTWVLCDVIRSLDRKLLASYSSLAIQYGAWAAAPDLKPSDRRSVESALTLLQTA